MYRIVSVVFLVIISLGLNSQEFKNISVSASKLEFNTSLSEISCDYSNGKLMFFQNKKAIKQYSQYYDLFLLDSTSIHKKKGANDKVSLTDQLTIVTTYHEGPCFVDEVNNKIYVTISHLGKKEMKREKRLNTLNSNRLRLLEGDYNNGVISNLKEFPYNNPLYNLAHATYSQATKRLYFASSMPGGQGESDIFYCAKKTDGSWDKPVNIGKRINTAGNEFFPQVKNGVLFFASNGQRKQVGQDLDVYYIKETDFETNFPVALEGMNSEADDFAICFTDREDVFEGFFTSNRGNKFSGDDDIYSFEISNVEYQKAYDLYVNFKVNDDLLKNGEVTLLDENENEIAKKLADKNNDYVFPSIEKGKEYRVMFNDSTYSRLFELPVNYYSGMVRETFDIEEDPIFKDTLLVNTVNQLVSELDSQERVIAKVDSVIYKEKPINKTNFDSSLVINDTAILNTVKAKQPDLTAIKTEKKETIETAKKVELLKFDKKETFENIYFAFDSYTIYPYSQNKLDKLIAYVKENKVRYIVIDAYTDSRGNSTYNEKLSVKRALSCREYLMNKGISEDQIKYTGFGETKLVNRCGNGVKCPESKHKLNRRIEFTLIY